jgi:hypothetical protein
LLLSNETAGTDVVLMQKMVAGSAAEAIKIDGRILKLCRIMRDEISWFK